MSVSLRAAATTAQFAPPPASATVLWTQPEPEVRDNPDLVGVVLHFAPDRLIYAEGDNALSFYKVVSGAVRTCRFLNDGRRQIDAFHATGDVFGLEAGDTHRLGAEAVTDCAVIAYRRRGLEAVVSHDDKLGLWFFSHAMATLGQAREHSLLLGRGSAAQKIACFLLEVDEQQGKDKTVELAMSRQDIADYLGLTIETVREPCRKWNATAQ